MKGANAEERHFQHSSQEMVEHSNVMMQFPNQLNENDQGFPVEMIRSSLDGGTKARSKGRKQQVQHSIFEQQSLLNDSQLMEEDVPSNFDQS